MKKTHKTTDDLFRMGLIFKGVDSLFEVVGGVLLTMPTKLSTWVLVLSHHELFRHHEVMAGRLDHLADTISVKAHLGSALYLMFHGLAKVVLIGAIFYGKKWGYLGLIGVLSIFATIELFRACIAGEIVTGALSLFDFLVVVLILKEYRFRFGNLRSSSTQDSTVVQ